MFNKKLLKTCTLFFAILVLTYLLLISAQTSGTGTPGADPAQFINGNHDVTQQFNQGLSQGQEYSSVQMDVDSLQDGKSVELTPNDKGVSASWGQGDVKFTFERENEDPMVMNFQGMQQGEIGDKSTVNFVKQEDGSYVLGDKTNAQIGEPSKGDTQKISVDNGDPSTTTELNLHKNDKIKINKGEADGKMQVDITTQSDTVIEPDTKPMEGVEPTTKKPGDNFDVRYKIINPDGAKLVDKNEAGTENVIASNVNGIVHADQIGFFKLQGEDLSMNVQEFGDFTIKSTGEQKAGIGPEKTYLFTREEFNNINLENLKGNSWMVSGSEGSEVGDTYFEVGAHYNEGEAGVKGVLFDTSSEMRVTGASGDDGGLVKIKLKHGEGGGTITDVYAETAHIHGVDDIDVMSGRDGVAGFDIGDKNVFINKDGIYMYQNTQHGGNANFNGGLKIRHFNENGERVGISIKDSNGQISDTKYDFYAFSNGKGGYQYSLVPSDYTFGNNGFTTPEGKIVDPIISYNRLPNDYVSRVQQMSSGGFNIRDLENQFTIDRQMDIIDQNWRNFQNNQPVNSDPGFYKSLSDINDNRISWPENNNQNAEYTMLKFGHEECIPCQDFEADVKRGDVQSAFPNAKIGSVHLEKFSEEGDKFSAVQWPTAILFDKNGNQIQRVEGFTSLEELRSKMKF